MIASIHNKILQNESKEQWKEFPLNCFSKFPKKLLKVIAEPKRKEKTLKNSLNMNRISKKKNAEEITGGTTEDF